jgi:hypothetical protein
VTKGVTVDDRVWQKILRAVLEGDNWKVKIGVLASSGGGDSHGGTDATNADIAFFQELGTRDIPARSFIGSTFREHKAGELRAMLTGISKRLVTGAIDIKRGLEILGAWGANAVKNTITQTDIPPPLAAATIAAKGSSKPLVDTSQLLGAISWQVTNEASE